MSQFKIAEFDRNDPKNQGRPSYFDLDAFISIVEQYITCDEVETALYLLDHMPAFYRDNYPVECVILRDRLYKQFFTSLEYAKDGCKISDMVNQPREKIIEPIKLERGWLAHGVVKELNDNGSAPWIYELAPGGYWLPFMLKETDRLFTYFGPSLNAEMQNGAKDNIPYHWRAQSMPEQKRIFIAFELIEHLENPTEIYHHSVKAGGDFDVILLSTPKYTYGGGMPNWYESDLGHLRAYTPREFLSFAQKHWPLYDWQYYDGAVMMLKGDKK